MDHGLTLATATDEVKRKRPFKCSDVANIKILLLLGGMATQERQQLR